MVESGSTTTYLGKGQLFPNWLVYDSSLFEIKVNGKAAKFFAPAPTYDNVSWGYLGISGVNGQLPQIIKGPSTGFDLMVNINEDGTLPPRPTVDSSSYLHSEVAPMSISEPVPLDPTKPLYLYDVDWSSMMGKNNLDFDLYQHPYIECAELNLILYYNPDQQQWKMFQGEAFTTLMLEWRFKELYSPTKSLPFYDMFEWRVDEVLTDQKDMLHPHLSLIPNEIDPSLLEVHARTFVNGIVFDNNLFPRYQGVSLVAWPNLTSKLDQDRYQASDKSTVLLGISSNVSITNTLFRINGRAAWLTQNTLPAEYDYTVFQSYNDSKYNESRFVKPTIDTDGVLQITDGTTIVTYYGRTGQWEVISSPEQRIVVEGMFLRDGEDSPEVASNQYFDMTNYFISFNYDETNINGYFAFRILNMNAIGLISSPDDIPDSASKYIAHEYITYVGNYSRFFRMVPNFEVYGHQKYKLLVNGEEVQPTLTMGVNDVLTKVSYELTGVDAFLDIDVANMTAYLDVVYDKFAGQASAPTGFTYFLDGNREDNLSANSQTCLFNRCIPVALQWIYTDVIPHKETIPLFVDMYRNNLSTIEENLLRDEGLYLDHYYTATGKTASLSVALPLNELNAVNYSSLVMKHERDVVRGWKKSGYTGPVVTFDDFVIRKNSIGFPIIVKDEGTIEEPEVISPLPLTFDADSIGLQGMFDIKINGVIYAGGVGPDDLKSVLLAHGGFTVTDTDTDVPDFTRYGHSSNDLEMTGTFDVYVNGESYATDVTDEDLVNDSINNIDLPLMVRDSLPVIILPPPPEPS